MEDYLEVEEDICNLTITSIRNCSRDRDATITYPDEPAKIIVPVTLGIVFIVGVTANALLLWFILRVKRKNSPHIILIASLAVSDLSMLIIGMPFVSTIYTFEDWPYGLFICKLSEFAQTLSASAAVLNLTALSADRFFRLSAVKSHPSQKSPVLLISVIWITSACFALPDLISSTILDIASMHFCIIYPESFGTLYSKFHVCLKFIYLFMLPLITISIFYLLIALTLIRHRELVPAINSQLLGRREQTITDKTVVTNRRKRATIMILCLVVLFIVTWLPRYIYLLWFHFDSSEFSEAWHIFKIIGFCLMFMNSCLNPFIYASLDNYFRCFLLRIKNKPYNQKEEDSESNDCQQVTMSVLTQQLNSAEKV